MFQPIGLYNGKYEWAARAGSGDCSLNLMAIDIKFDDGLWECQVTASSFESQDALASKPARLVVRGKTIFHPDTVQYYYFMFYSLDKLKPKTKTKNQIFLLLTFDFVIRLLNNSGGIAVITSFCEIQRIHTLL